MGERLPRNMSDYEAEVAAFRWDRPERFNFAIDVVDRWASERPDAPAMLHCDDRGNRKVYSWRELAERSVHAALFLRDLGLRPGDGVFTMLPRLAEWWILALGCMRANLVLMPGTTMLTGKDVKYRLELGRARAVVTTAEHLPKFEVGAHSDVIAWVCTDEAPVPWVRFRTQTVDGARAAEFPDTAADDRMLVYFTSGTTGMPKMVPQTHASYGIGHAITGKYWLDLGPDDVHFTLSDTGWAKCAWGKVFGPWSQGACSVVYDFRGRFEGRAILDLLAREKVTTFCAPPTAWRAIVLEDLKKWTFPALRHVVSAGEPLNPEVIDAWKRTTGLTIREGYGQTETVAVVGMFQCLPFRPGSMGKPSPGFDVRIIDHKGREVPAGQEGDIAVRVKPGARWGCSPATSATRPPTPPRSAATSTSPATAPCATRTATSGSSDARTTSSRPPATGWARSRWSRPSSSTRRSPSRRWWACPTRSSASASRPSWSSSPAGSPAPTLWPPSSRTT